MNSLKTICIRIIICFLLCEFVNIPSAFAIGHTGSCDNKNDSPPSMDLPSSGPPVDQNKSAGTISINTSGHGSNKYAACNPSSARFSSSSSSVVNLCEIPPTAASSTNGPVTFSDCPGPPAKPIKFQYPAVNCDMNYLYNKATSTDTKSPDYVSPIVFSQTNTGINSCITVPNFFGTVINTITTLGISIAMLENFHSAVIQHDNSCSDNAQTLEGAFVDFDSLLNNTTYCPPNIQKDKCLKYFLKGQYISADGSTCVKESSKSTSRCKPLFPNRGHGSVTTNNPCASLPNIDKPALNPQGQVLVDGNGSTLYCPYTRCNMPTPNILAAYDDLTFQFLGLGFGENSTVDMRAGDSQDVGWAGIVHLKADNNNDQLCISMQFTLGYTTISCKPAVPPNLNWPSLSYQCVSPACHVASTVSTPGGPFVGPASFRSITGRMMQCVTETITQLVQGGDQCPSSMLLEFQINMRDTVRAALILYVIILGISIAIRGELPQKGEIAVFVAKIAFVLWAAVGTFNISKNNTVECTGTKWCPTNGLEFIYSSAVAALESFPNMIMGAVCNPAEGDNCVCHYPESLYAPGYEYLALWDSLDCRFSYYLGLNSPTSLGNDAILAGGAALAASSSVFALFFALLFGFQLLAMLLLITFAIFLISIVLFFINLYILCLISLTILIYIGPIFIPMILFQNTKKLFESWLGLVLGYALQPAVVTAFISLMIVLFDSIVYSDCLFQQKTTQTGHPYWEIKCLSAGSNCACSESCQNSLGYLVAYAGMGGVSWQGFPMNGLPLFSYQYYDNMAKLGASFATALWQVTLFGFIFYYFSRQLASFASDLTGSANLGGFAVSPTKVIDKAGKFAKLATKAAWNRATGQTKELGEEVAKTARRKVEEAKSRMSGAIGKGKEEGKASGGGGSGMSGSVDDTQDERLGSETDDEQEASGGEGVGEEGSEGQDSGAPGENEEGDGEDDRGSGTGGGTSRPGV